MPTELSRLAINNSLTAAYGVCKGDPDAHNTRVSTTHHMSAPVSEQPQTLGTISGLIGWQEAEKGCPENTNAVKMSSEVTNNTSPALSAQMEMSLAIRHSD